MDFPSSTTVSACLEHWGTDEFPDAFLTELTEHENDLPLQDMCSNGGSPSGEDWAELDDLKIEGENEDGHVTGDFAVSFTESSPTGCRDLQWTDRQSGRISFSLDLETGHVEFSHPYETRQYEPDEF